MCIGSSCTKRLLSVHTFLCVRACVWQTLLSACEENDVDAFTEALRNYDSVSRLDSWHTSMLLRVKKGIEGESNLL